MSLLSSLLLLSGPSTANYSSKQHWVEYCVQLNFAALNCLETHIVTSKYQHSQNTQPIHLIFHLYSCKKTLFFSDSHSTTTYLIPPSYIELSLPFLWQKTTAQNASTSIVRGWICQIWGKMPFQPFLKSLNRPFPQDGPLPVINRVLHKVITLAGSYNLVTTPIVQLYGHFKGLYGW